MNFEILNPTNVVFEISMISSIIIAIILIKIQKIHQNQNSLAILTKSTGLFMIAMLIVNIFFAISHMDVLLGIYINREVLYAISYAFYFILWILGINFFLNNIVRLPPDRVGRFRRTTNLLNFQLVFTFLLTIFTSGILRSVRENPHFGDLVEGSFALISQGAIITFIYFYRQLGFELNKNSSKVIKARLQLMRYSVLLQIVISLTVAVGTTVLLLNRYDDAYVEMYTFSTICILTVLCSLILIWSINIPNRLRIRFNLTPSRFEYVLKSRT